MGTEVFLNFLDCLWGYFRLPQHFIDLIKNHFTLELLLGPSCYSNQGPTSHQPCMHRLYFDFRLTKFACKQLESFNTQYMTNSTLVCLVKIEYVTKNGLKMMVKSGLEKIFLKFFHAHTKSFLLLNLYFWSKLFFSMR